MSHLAPSAPVIVTETSTASSIYVMWDPPTMPHGIIRYYQVTYHPVDQREKIVEVMTAVSPAYINITGLLAWTTYVYTVAAFNIVLGESVESLIRTQETSR